MTHELKTWTEYFRKIVEGQKTFEVRLNDRDYQVGDTLHLKEWLPMHEVYTYSSAKVEAVYILHGGGFGIENGYCVFGIKVIEKINC